MAILVVVVRHAKTSFDPQAPDGVQTISESGRQMQSEVNASLKSFGIEPTEIWTSPALRAVQTAELIAKDFGGIVPKQEFALGELEMFDEVEITDKLAQVPDESTIVIVSHGPQIMRLVSHWMGGQAYTSLPPTSSATLIEFPHKVIAGEAHFVRLISYSDITSGKYKKPTT